MNWHVKAARLQARFPWKTWSQICAEIGRRRKVKQPPRKIRLPYAD